ncbi:thiamine biosynthesis lipoprotein [Geosporobacter subterraneus DSM 17957]|uniref:FAD:protein FMN transferase n=1 Tax=Geosporobacter subterraneus DSM 17957 TaxID=1121919 RepID=A0A1M6ECS1_9FIRM|nr:FAD:protein FMN transferase [Geosporobacter subterraneus]SHI83276.1 thiamine biosynthesis lipoprotein [Geosporobacter subterraneus DSM 17957]
MKRITGKLAMLLLVMLFFSGCGTVAEKEYSKFNDSFYDTFDTLTQVVGYTETEQEFQAYVEKIHSRFQELHRYYDIYNNYEGINNVKTINDNAGIQPVKVDREIIDLILFAKDWYKKTNGNTNIAMGAVLEIWHEYREAGMDDPENAELPPMKVLQEAAKHTDINKIIVDTQNNTVYLEDPRMKLNVGAIAKGYATELVAREIMAEGFTSGIISAGGNIRVLGKPLDGVRERWGIGIQNPDKLIVTDEQNLLDTVFINNASVVSSGDYQRYYIVDGKPIHHLIDPKTLMPGEYYRAVTVVAKDSGVADFLSTEAFLLPLDQSKRLVESLEDVEMIWVMPDGTVEATDGMKKIMKSHGATGAKAE